jgi:hypothetical protein
MLTSPLSCFSIPSVLQIEQLNSATAIRPQVPQPPPIKAQSSILHFSNLEMCFFFGPKPKNITKTTKTRKSYGSSSSSRSRSRSNHPFSDYESMEREKHRYVQGSKGRDYEGVFSDLKHIQDLEDKLGPGSRYTAATPPMPTTTDIEKMMATTLAKAGQERERKDEEKARKKKEKEHEARIARLEQEWKEDKERAAREERDREREASHAKIDTLAKMIEGQKKEKDLDDVLEKKLLECFGGVKGITWAGNNNSAYGNNGSVAHSRQGLLGSADDVAERQTRFENKMENKFRTFEDDQDFIMRRQSRRLNYS